jgi:hypothetical protein
MNNKRNMILGLVVAVAVIGGGVFFMQNRDSEKSETASSSQQASSNTPTFNPKSTEDVAFTAEFVSTDTATAENTTGVLKSDGKGTLQISASTVESGDIEMYMLSDGSSIACQDGVCYKTPISPETDTTRDDFNLTQSEITKYQSTAKYEGEADCPAGKCYVWSYIDDENTNTKVYIEKDTNKVSKVEGSDATTNFSMTLKYDNVSITIPTNVVEIPTE